MPALVQATSSSEPWPHARDHLSGTLEQHRQNLKGLLLKLDLEALLAQLSRAQIQLKCAEANSTSC